MNNFQIEKIVNKLKKWNQKAFVLKTDKLGRSLVTINRLIETGKVEQHDWACDISCILEGEGKFEKGGRIIDRVIRSKGEWRGTILKNSKKISLKPGVIIITEPGIPHRTVVSKKSTLIFITYKQYIKNYKIS